MQGSLTLRPQEEGRYSLTTIGNMLRSLISSENMNNKKVYTLTCTWAQSYGAVLQAFALAKTINNLGWKAEVINYQPGYDPVSRRRMLLPSMFRPAFMEFLRDSEMLTAKAYRDCHELANAGLSADVFVVGSDQVWNCTTYGNGNDDAMFLDFASPSARRVSYAASLSMPEVPPMQSDRYKRLLDRFDAISVREASGAKALQNIDVFGARVVIDPVYLVDSGEWADLAGRSTRPAAQDKYVLVVGLERREAIYEYARTVADRMGVELHSLTSGPRAFKKPKGVDRNCRNVSVYDYLNIVRGAEAVVTDSFHAMSFALIFNRDVTVLPRGDGGNSRMVDLLSDLGLADRIATSSAVNDGGIDFEAVNQLLKSKVDDAKDYLKTSLAGGDGEASSLGDGDRGSG